MIKTLLTLSLVVILVLFAYGITLLTQTDSANSIALDGAVESEPLVEHNASSIEVGVRTEEVELFGGGQERIPGTGITKTARIPYIIIDGETIDVFGDEKYLVVRDYSFSPSRNFLYLSRGQIAQDSAVTPYIYDVSDRNLQKVCLADLCEGFAGFPSQNSITVNWSRDGLLEIEFDNPFLTEGSPEAGPSTGIQNFISISAEEPWLLKELQ